MSGLIGLSILAAGCDQRDVDLEKMLAQQVDRVTLENTRLKRELADRDQTIDSLRRQVDELLDLGPGRLDHLFTIDRIELVRLTGGADYDGRPGDDGVTVYVRPVDVQGDPIKAAGEIRVQLLDVTQQGQPRELGLYVINDPGKLRAAWHSGIMTDHYTVKCGWQPGVPLPASREVTVRVTFLDWLTGREFTAQEMVRVSLVEGQEVSSCRPPGKPSGVRSPGPMPSCAGAG
ncbi:MAG: hypothetical protein JSV19_07740 [Phycisphaerales bacterium]|nr:MAG: hypothetical protein JSV19_07740 [Phycisphaerales bacterium]